MPDITRQEAAKRLGVSVETVRRMIDKGDIVGRRVKSTAGPYRWMVDAASLPPRDPYTLTDGEGPPETLPVPVTLPAPILEQFGRLATGEAVDRVEAAVAALSEKVNTYQELIAERDRLQAENERLRRELAEERARPWWRRRR